MIYYLNLFYISTIVTLINDTGFWDVLDNQINKKIKFHHLPHIFFCSLCQAWWICLIYTLIMGKITIFNVLICLIMGYMTEIISPLFRLTMEIIKKIIEKITKIL